MLIEPKIEDELLKMNRRLEKIEKMLDLLMEDRNLFETIQARLTALEEAVQLARQNDNAVRRDLREEINSSGDRVVDKVEKTIQEGVQTFKRGGTKTKSLIDKILRR